MAKRSSLVSAAASLIEENGPPALALCVIHSMRDKRFRDLLSTIVELNPAHWPAIRELAKGYSPSG